MTRNLIAVESSLAWWINPTSGYEEGVSEKAANSANDILVQPWPESNSAAMYQSIMAYPDTYPPYENVGLQVTVRPFTHPNIRLY